MYTHLWSIQKYHDEKDFDKTNITFQMNTNRSGKLSKFKEELNLILPYITLKEGDYKVVNIIDHNLGESGDFASFLYKDDNDCKIDGRYGSIISGNIRQVFDYWKKERYYK